MRYTTVILAGGRSRRFGRDKASLRLGGGGFGGRGIPAKLADSHDRASGGGGTSGGGGEPLVAWQARRLGAGDTWLSLGHRGSLPAGAAACGRWVCDDVADAGPLHALLAVLRAMARDRAEPRAAPGRCGTFAVASGGAEPLVAAFVPVDMPLLVRTDLDRLARRLALHPNAAAVMGRWDDGPRAGSLAPLPSVWRVDEGLAVIGRAVARGQRALHPLGLLPAVITEPLRWPRDRAFGVNVNTPAQWQAVQHSLFASGDYHAAT